MKFNTKTSVVNNAAFSSQQETIQNIASNLHVFSCIPKEIQKEVKRG